MLTHGECKICSGSRLYLFSHTAHCRDCGVLLYYPYPVDDSEITTPEEIDKKSISNPIAWYAKSSFHNHVNFTNMLRFAMGDEERTKSWDILDYGGGGGQFALVCKSHFPMAQVHLTDISDSSLLSEWRPLNHQIPFSDFAGDARRFDFIFMNDVFEHVSDPLFVLRQLAEKLKDGGKIFIDTPRQFWIYPVIRALSRKLYVKLLNGTVSERHLQIWSSASFGKVVRDAGLAVHKFQLASEYTMPADFYLNNMGIRNPVIRFVGKLFYGGAKYLAKNKIVCVLAKS